MLQATLGLVTIVLAAIFYGSYYVPAKKYDIHDGLVFQWYQCSGILLAGLTIALLRNQWSTDFRSTGFYVAPEGLLSGLMFVVANAIATVSVKMCGLGNYYTVHELSNLGLTLIVGIFGKSIGVPATPPSRIGLACFGFLLVLLGMMPVMFMEKDHPVKQLEEKETQRQQSEPAPLSPTPLSPTSPSRPPTSPSRPRKLEDIFGPQTSSRPPPPASVPEDEELQPRVDRRTSWRGLRPSPLIMPDFKQLNSLTWDGTLGRPQLGDEPLTPPLSCLGDLSMVAREVEDIPMFESASEPLLSCDSPKNNDGFRTWLIGLLLAFVAGGLYAAIYIPQLFWKARLREEGYLARGVDYNFAMSVGIYMGSTVWLLCGGLYKRYTKQGLHKSVLRPALFSGVLYGVGALFFLWAMMLVPYAIGYGVGCGGALAVSLAWGVFVFGEAASIHNRRCVMCSFTGVLAGCIVLGLSA